VTDEASHQGGKIPIFPLCLHHILMTAKCFKHGSLGSFMEHIFSIFFQCMPWSLYRKVFFQRILVVMSAANLTSMTFPAPAMVIIHKTPMDKSSIYGFILSQLRQRIIFKTTKHTFPFLIVQVIPF